MTMVGICHFDYLPPCNTTVSWPGTNHGCPQQQSHPSCSLLTTNSRWNVENNLVSDCPDPFFFMALFSKWLHNPCGGGGGLVVSWLRQGAVGRQDNSSSRSVGAFCLQLTCVTTMSFIAKSSRFTKPLPGLQSCTISTSPVQMDTGLKVLCFHTRGINSTSIRVQDNVIHSSVVQAQQDHSFCSPRIKSSKI